MSDLSYADVSALLQARWPEHKIEPSLERVRRLVELRGARITLDSGPLSERGSVEADAKSAASLDGVAAEPQHRPATCEATTGMACAVAGPVPVDVPVIEVRLGGAWASANAADGTVSA